MDIVSAYTGIKFIKESLSFILSAKIESTAKEKINEVLEKLGVVQDTLFYLREELSQLQAENYELKDRLKAVEDWDAKAARYELKETEGGAVVYMFKDKPTHYICPDCMNKKEVQIFQGRRGSMSGDLDCPSCNKQFPVKPHRNLDPPESRGDWSPFT
jgi:regulator of replication initiation timing